MFFGGPQELLQGRPPHGQPPQGGASKQATQNSLTRQLSPPRQMTPARTTMRQVCGGSPACRLRLRFARMRCDFAPVASIPSIF